MSAAKKPGKLTTAEMEVALAHFLDYRTNLIVPNVWWGMSNMHECDLLVVSKAGYLTEVEIKISRADLRQDKKKRHGHHCSRIKRLFFALPTYLENCKDLVPDRAGIILVRPRDADYGPDWVPRCRQLRPAESRPHTPKISDEDRYKIARLGAIRIWDLKQKLSAD
ncbi:MAG: MmcB family DNA repair protein [Planctomycetes bacterium]|nr:MmcB family DNA repair protein [Planctomycetota bacterium]